MNVDNGGTALRPPSNTSSVVVNPLGGTEGQVTSQNASLNFNAASGFKITNPGEAFQFTQTYSGPGVTNQTVIQRVTEVTSVTDTTSILPSNLLYRLLPRCRCGGVLRLLIQSQ